MNKTKKKAMKKAGGTIAAAALALLGMGLGSSVVQAAAWTLGNSGENIMNNGILAWDAEKEELYYANTADNNRLYVRKQDQDIRLTRNSCSDINVLEDSVYYVTGGEDVICYDLVTGAEEVVFSVAEGIDEMYVTGVGDFYYLSQGDIFRGDVSGQAELVEDVKDSIRHFIPTSSGMIYAIGQARDYDLYAEGDRIARHVFSFREYENYLLLTMDGEDYQAGLSQLFGGHAADALVPYDLGDGLSASYLSLVEEDGECEVCEENAMEGSLEDDWNLVQANYTGISDELDASRASETISILYDESVSDGQRNMVKRAYQQHLIEWIPQKNVSSWQGSNAMVFQAGELYHGLPYGQPTKSGAYTPWDCSLEKFSQAVADAGSVFYSSRATNGSTSAPYYSCDCSSFVSWAWDLPSRQYTGSLESYANTVSSQSIYAAQIGDALNLSGSHACMISDIGYRDDTMVYVDIIEQTPPITKLTRYGEGGSKTLADLTDKYFVRRSYKLIRNKTRDKAQYYASSAVLLEDENAGTIDFAEEEYVLGAGESTTIKYETTAAGGVYWSSSDPSIASVEKTGEVTAHAAGMATITLRVGPTKASVNVYVKPGEVQLSSAKAIATGGIKLTWKAVENADGYRVYRKNEEGKWTLLKKVTSAKYSDTDESLGYNSTYTYTVRAFKMIDDKEYTGPYNKNGISGRTAVATPKLKSVEIVDYQAQRLIWKAVEGAEGYRVYIKGSQDEKWIRLGETQETEALISNLETGDTYTYTVRAYYVEGDTKVLSWYDENGIKKKCVPATPVLEKAAAKSYNKIQISWGAVAGAESYRIYRKTADTDWMRVDTVSSDRLKYVDTDLPTGMEYFYTIRAVRKAGKKDILSGYDAKGISAKVDLATPVLLSAESKTAGKITLTWGSVAGAEKYRVYRKSADTEWVRIATLDSKDTSYVDSGLTGGESHIYTVRAYRKDNGGVLSGYNEEGITGVVKLNTPKLSAVKVIDRGRAKITWKKVTNAEGYRVYRKEGKNSWKKIGEAKGTSFMDEDLELGKTYTYTVRAIQTVNEKEDLSGYDEDGLSVTMKLAAPKITSVYSDAKKTATLTWEPVESADGYRVYYREKGGEWAVLSDVDAETLIFTKKKLTSGKEYDFTVRAFWKTDQDYYLGSYKTKGVRVKVK